MVRVRWALSLEYRRLPLEVQRVRLSELALRPAAVKQPHEPSDAKEEVSTASRCWDESGITSISCAVASANVSAVGLDAHACTQVSTSAAVRRRATDRATARPSPPPKARGHGLPTTFVPTTSSCSHGGQFATTSEAEQYLAVFIRPFPCRHPCHAFEANGSLARDFALSSSVNNDLICSAAIRVVSWV